MLMTPDRSENKPPSAARMSGVDRRTVEKISAIVKRSAIGLVLPTRRRHGYGGPPKRQRLAKADHRFTKKRFRGDEQDDRRLQYLDDVLGDVPCERIHRNAPSSEHSEQQCSDDHPSGMVASEQGHRDACEPVAIGEPVVVAMP